MAKLNGWSTEAALYEGLKEVLDQRESSMKVFTAVHMLAAVAGMELDQFAGNHTLLPICRGVRPEESGPVVPTWEPSRVLFRSGMRPLKPFACFCRSCSVEDVEFFGQSYWRRDHQIPGIKVCAKHKVRLTRAALEQVSLSSPAECLKRSVIKVETTSHIEKSNEFVDRYLELCRHLLERPRVRNQLHVTRHLMPVAAQQGYGYGGGVYAWTSLMIDKIKHLFGSEFVEEVFPGASENLKGESCVPIERCLLEQRSGSRPLTYVAIAAVLFENADAAATAVFESHTPATFLRPSFSRHSDFTLEEFDEDLSLGARHSRGVKRQPHMALSSARSRPKVVRSQPKESQLPAQLSAVVELVLQGDHSIKEACRGLNVSDHAVRQILEAVFQPFREVMDTLPARVGG